MRTYAFISFYLWICFSALLLFQNSVLSAEHLPLLPFSAAAIKALILGKFIVIGRAINFGGNIRHNVLLHRILWKSLTMLLLLMIFTFVEELVVGLVHGQAIADTLAELMARSWVQWLAPSIIMLLVLIPMIAFEEVDLALGKGGLKRILLDRVEH